MTQKRDQKSALRAALANQARRNAKSHVSIGSSGIFVQVTQAVIFMYLIVIGYMLMGTIGLIFVSVLFLIALFSPALLTAGIKFWNKRKTEPETKIQITNQEIDQKG